MGSAVHHWQVKEGGFGGGKNEKWRRRQCCNACSFQVLVGCLFTHYVLSFAHYMLSDTHYVLSDPRHFGLWQSKLG